MTAVRLLQVTDPHLYGDESRSIYGVNTAVSFRRVLEQALSDPARRPHAILATGDIADDHSAAAYDNFRRALLPYDLPVYCIPGNHDAPALMQHWLNDDQFQTCGSAMLADWGVILLDTHVAGSAAGRLDEAELARLEDEMKRFAGRPTLVCLHHPPVPVGSAWIDGLGLTNATAIWQIVDRFKNVKAMLAGHVHQAFDQPRGLVRVLTSPSTCAQFTPGLPKCLMDTRPPGYRWLDLMPDGSIETQVVWLRDWVVQERPPDDRYEGNNK